MLCFHLIIKITLARGSSSFKLLKLAPKCWAVGLESATSSLEGVEPW